MPWLGRPSKSIGRGGSVQVDYRELIEEIKEITTVDGFVSSCLEIKESMFFYDRDLMLAAYSASLELLAVAALFSASLHGKRELHRAETEVVRHVDELLEELTKYRLPLDIQYVVDRYLQDAGFQTSLRMPVYTQMMRNYASSTEYREESIDMLIQQAHRCIAKDSDDLEKELNLILGQVGTKMLRGGHLRPIWLQISHPRIYIILLGLQTMMNNFQVTPYYNFPFQDITTERQKRKKIAGNVVLDLGVFRNFRQGGSGYTDLNVVLVKDDYDHYLENFLSNFDYLDGEPDQEFINLIVAIFETRLVNEELENGLLLKLLVYCDYWQISEVSDVALEILELLDPDDPLYFGFWTLLRSLDGKALPAIRRFIRKNRESPLLPYISIFLSRGKPGKRKWDLLTEIFENYPYEDEDKAQMARSIAHYGGTEAVTYLENALADAQATKDAYRLGIEEALASARANED